MPNHTANINRKCAVIWNPQPPGPNQVSVAVQTLYDGGRATLAQDAKGIE
jgi:hypothetical protein